SSAHGTHNQTHIDGQSLHDRILGKVTYDLEYAGPEVTFSPDKKISMGVFGYFTCQTRQCKNRTWSSGLIATELLFSTRTHQYRTTMYAQRCHGCEAFAKPKVDYKRYVISIVSKLDLWTGVRDPLPYTGKKSPKGLHDSERCAACDVNKCPWKKMGR
ncbi:hypothetical protein BGZ54_004418, partial [Gamsiella multidivaricata]